MAKPGEPGVEHATREFTDAEIDAVLEPEVARWFHATFASFTPPQRFAVKEIHDRRHTLISSPTGSGKTLSAFLAAINELVAEWKRGTLEDRVYILYVSPLKALNNDIERNLQQPLEGVGDVFRADGRSPPAIRVGVRTGDTPARERQKMTIRPPHIVITTPETLAILLNSPRFCTHLRRVRWVIVDEVHSLAESKRGTHLLLSLERLTHAAAEPPVRIGLSATCHPLERMARFLVGGRDAAKRPVLVVDASYLKKTRLEVVAPPETEAIGDGTEEADAGRPLYETLDRIIQDHRTTLVFTNTRAGTERVVHHLKTRYGERYADAIGAHHGSLSRERRLEVERRLKAGELKAVVCSTSLELGIDIGYVDCVVLLSSPKSIARALQRVGRSGHKLHETSEGILVATDPEDLIECTVLAQRARLGVLDAIHVPEGCLDVLCQHIVGMALERDWGVHEAFDLVRNAWPYRELSMADFRKCLAYLAGHPELEERRIYGKIRYDPEGDTFGRRGRSVRPIYYLNSGTIPDTTRAKVFAGEQFVGELEEDFLENLVPGDVFVLGGQQYEFRSAAGTKARVVQAKGRRVTVPTWYSESLPMSAELAQAVHAFRAELAASLDHHGRADATAALRRDHGLDRHAAETIVDHVDAQRRYSGVPAADEVLVEEFEDPDDGRTVYVFHTPVGRRANDALSRAFALRVRQMKGVRVETLPADTGFALVVPLITRLTQDDVRGLFHIDVARQLLDALDGSEYFHRRFRHVAARAFLILRRLPGRTASVGRQQVNARRLISRLERLDPQFPVLKETYREIREDAMDLATAERFCFEVLTRQRKVRYVRGLPAPSPFSYSLALAARGATGTDRQVMLQRMRDTVETEIRGRRRPPPRDAGGQTTGRETL